MSHHDNREKNWNISMTDEEYAAAEKQWRLTGLSKAEYGRRALRSATVMSRVNPDDQRQAARLTMLHSSVNEIAKVVQAIQKENLPNADESTLKYLRKVQTQIDEIESATADVANYFSSHLNW